MQTQELDTIRPIPAEYLDQGRLMSRPVKTHCGHTIQRIEFATNCSACGGNLQSQIPNINLARRIKSYVETNRSQLNLRANIGELLHGADNLDGFIAEISTFIGDEPGAVIVDVRDDDDIDEDAGLLGRMIHRFRRLSGVEKFLYTGAAAGLATMFGFAIYNGVQEIQGGNNDSGQN